MGPASVQAGQSEHVGQSGGNQVWVPSYVSRVSWSPELKEVVKNPFGGPDTILVSDPCIVGHSKCVGLHLWPVREEV